MDIGAWAEMDRVKIWNQLGQICKVFAKKQGLTGSEIHSRVDAGRSAEGQMSPALRALGRWRGVIVWLHSLSRAQKLLEMQEL